MPLILSIRSLDYLHTFSLLSGNEIKRRLQETRKMPPKGVRGFSGSGVSLGTGKICRKILAFSGNANPKFVSKSYCSITPMFDLTVWTALADR